MNDAEVKSIRKVVSQCEVSVALFFGSAERGQTDSNSDIDVGVYIDIDPHTRAYEREMMRVITGLDLQFDRFVDATDLRIAEDDFVRRVVRQGTIVYDPDGRAVEIG